LEETTAARNRASGHLNLKGQDARGLLSERISLAAVAYVTPFRDVVSLFTRRGDSMLKFLGSTIGIIFLIGLLVVIGLLALVF
jgi:hypothetical protein